MEKQKQNPQNIPNDTKLALSPEQEKQLQKEKQQVLLLSKMQRESLSNEALSSYLEKFHQVDLSKYSSEIQKKFAEEIQIVFSEFKDFDESMITRLKSIREGMSFGLEEGKSNEYYRNLIIGNAIETRVKVLQETINTQYGETMELKGTKVNKEDFQNLETNMKNLDTQNGLHVFESVVSKLRPNINGGLNFTTLNFQEIFKKECIQSGVKYNDELYKEYNKVYQAFVGRNMVFHAKDGNGMIKYKGKGFGFESGGINGLTNDRLKDIYKDKVDSINIEKMGTADLVILLRVLFGIVPVAGEVVGGYDDFSQANAGVNADGSIQKTWEKVLGYSSPVLGVLSVIGVGYGIKVALNSPKYAKVMATIGKVVDKLSKNKEMLKDFAKNEKVMGMLEAMKGVVPKVGELLEKMKGIRTEIKPKIEGKGKVEKLPVQQAANDEKYSNVTKLKPKEIPENLYKSHFSTEIPESLKAQNPLAWIDTSGEIHYNQTFLEQKFGIKITTENGKTLFDGKSLKDHKKASEILDYLKELKAHEVTHRILEARGVDRIAVGNRIYSQEEICSIVDGSKKISKTELEALERALKEKLGDDFRLLKNGELDADFVRRYDTKMVAMGEDVRRESEAAKDGENIVKISNYYSQLESTGIDISQLKEGNYPEDELLETLENIMTKLQNQEIREKLSIISGLGLKISIFELKYAFDMSTDKLKKIEMLIKKGLSQCTEIKEIYYILNGYENNVFDIATQLQGVGFQLSKLDLHIISKLNLTEFELNNIVRLKGVIKDFKLIDVLSDMKGVHGVVINRSFENNILSMKEGFNPNKALQDIKKLPKDMRKNALERFKELYEEQIQSMLSIKDNVSSYIQNHNLKDLKTQEDIDNFYKGLLGTLQQDLSKLSIEQRQKTMESISGYLTKMINTDLFFPLGTKNPKKILSQHLGFNEEIITGEVIKAKFEGFPVFFVSPDDYNKVLTMGKEVTPATSGVGHIDKYKSDYVILDGGYIVISGDPTKVDLYSVLNHEVRHGLNTFIMPDVRDNIFNTALARGKDEIIAYLSGGSNLSGIFNELAFSDGYDYFKMIKKSSPDEYNVLRQKYISLLGKNFELASQLIKQGVGLDELSIIPFEKWYKIKPKQGLEKVFEIYQDGDIRKKIEYENGSVQVGIFGKDGVMKGGVKKYLGYEENGDFDINGNLLKGTIKTPDGTILDGEFNNGNIVKGISKGSNGVYTEGEFINGEIANGKRIFKGITSEGIFQKGILVNGRVTFENGDFFEGIFNDGKIFDGVGSISGYAVKITQGNIIEK